MSTGAAPNGKGPAKTPAPQPGAVVINMYEARPEIHVREVKGCYARLRWACVWLTQLVFYGLPWMSWNGRQAVLFDLVARKFYIFGMVLWPQDFIYLAVLLIICAWLLFLVTAIAGRVWCGFACPQTVYTEIFMWIERRIEGSRSARMRLERQPASLAKVARKSAKHAAWGLLALWTGFTFVGYFTPIQALQHAAATLGLGPWEWFWILFYAAATYGNAGWLREQVCKYMCPYARFQSAMFDRDTLVVSYDVRRGEPRGALARSSEGAARQAGDCIDCTMCVQVCPTGIDIRDGLQYECIGCAACVDACNDVMRRIGAAPGLIRYSTENALRENLAPAAVRRRALRPRTLIYTGMLALVVAVFLGTLFMRAPLKVDVIRDRGAMGREVEDGLIENVYRLQLMNTSESTQRYRISVSGIDGIALASPALVTLESTASRGVPVKVRVGPGHGAPGSNRIEFQLTSLDGRAGVVKENAVFFVPRN